MSEPYILMGAQDTEQDKLGVLLGVWNPLFPSQVEPSLLAPVTHHLGL